MGARCGKRAGDIGRGYSETILAKWRRLVAKLKYRLIRGLWGRLGNYIRKRLQ